MTPGRRFVTFPRALLDLESSGTAAQNRGGACARKGRNHRRNVVLFPQPNPDEGGDDPDPSGSENGVGPLGGLPVFGSNQLSALVGVEGRQGPGNVPTAIASNALAPKIPLKAFSAHRNTPIVALSLTQSPSDCAKSPNQSIG